MMHSTSTWCSSRESGLSRDSAPAGADRASGVRGRHVRAILKGGTAINLFVRDLPRLSVDLDLVFANHELPREQAIVRIRQALRDTAERLNRRGFKTHIADAESDETKLLVRRDRIEVKVEANLVMCGTVHPARRATFTPAAREVLLADVEIPVVSLSAAKLKCIRAAILRSSTDPFGIYRRLSPSMTED